MTLSEKDNLFQISYSDFELVSSKDIQPHGQYLNFYFEDYRYPHLLFEKKA